MRLNRRQRQRLLREFQPAARCLAPHNPAVYQRDDGLGNPPPEPLRAVAVEFVTPGIGSGASSQVADFAGGLQGINPHIKHIEAT